MKHKHRRYVVAAAGVVCLVLLTECGARLFWKARGVGFFSAHRSVFRSFYPGVDELLNTPVVDDDTCFDILILAGSVLSVDYGNVEHLLRERLTVATGRCVRIHNLAAPAQTTLDSYYKYRHLGDRRFDLVIVYHGINEVRANNCSADRFEPDYSHYAWYKLINDFERRAEERWLIFPYTIKFVTIKLMDRLGLGSTLATHRPDATAAAFGCDIKTADSVRRNVSGIMELAETRKEPLLLMTFAHYLPEGYAEEAFDERSLDFTSHMYAVELWGKPECVESGLDTHNAVIRELSTRSRHAIFLDQEALVPREGRFFNDICHLTHEGCQRFVENLVPIILPLM